MSSKLCAGDVRRVLLERFPFKVVYVVRGRAVLVVAVAHTSRHPDYWKNASRVEPGAGSNPTGILGVALIPVNGESPSASSPRGSRRSGRWDSNPRPSRPKPERDPGIMRVPWRACGKPCGGWRAVVARGARARPPDRCRDGPRPGAARRGRASPSRPSSPGQGRRAPSSDRRRVAQTPPGEAKRPSQPSRPSQPVPLLASGRDGWLGPTVTRPVGDRHTTCLGVPRGEAETRLSYGALPHEGQNFAPASSLAPQELQKAPAGIAAETG